MMAATLAQGETILTNVAKEPEIIDLANCLRLMGANIKLKNKFVLDFLDPPKGIYK